MALFDWVKPAERTTSKVIADDVGDRFSPRVILRALEEAVPRYLNDVDQGKLIYPACKRTLSDPDGDVRSVWDHTRLEAIRYVMMVPGREFELLIEPARQLEMIDAYLLQLPHDDTVIEFTRACVQLSRIIAAAICTPARKFLASLS
jgi:hypothetical protein